MFTGEQAGYPSTREGLHEWRGQAKCVGVERELFFASVPSPEVQIAKQVCADCPVRAQCLDYALRVEPVHRWQQRHGVWGGLDPQEREALARKGWRKGMPLPEINPAYERYVKSKRG